MENKKKEAWEQLAVGIFRLLSIIAIIMFAIAIIGVMATGSDMFSFTALPRWIKFCLIPSLVWIGIMFLWAVGCAICILYLTITEDIKGAIKKLRK